MKKLNILAIILFTSIYSYCQEEVIPVPDFVNTLYVITPEHIKEKCKCSITQMDQVK